MLTAVFQGWCPWCGQHMGGWRGGGMLLVWLIVLVAIAGVVWLLLRRMGGRSGDRAEEALRERYARGDIDDETYRRMLAELRRP
jgi:putative membrane protein